MPRARSPKCHSSAELWPATVPFHFHLSPFNFQDVHRLAPRGMAGFVLATAPRESAKSQIWLTAERAEGRITGSMSSNQPGEGTTRQLTEADLVDRTVLAT